MHTLILFLILVIEMYNFLSAATMKIFPKLVLNYVPSLLLKIDHRVAHIYAYKVGFVVKVSSS